MVTLREFENRDEPRRAVVGTADDVTPREWVPGRTTNRERAVLVARGGPTLLGVLKALVGAIGSALS